VLNDLVSTNVKLEHKRVEHYHYCAMTKAYDSWGIMYSEVYSISTP
jgi:hypothetical protein